MAAAGKAAKKGLRVRNWSDRLTFRLAVLLSMALLPLGVIALGATAELQRSAQRIGERTLIMLARDAVAGERALVESALASARAIEALVLERLDDPAECEAFLRGYTERSNIYSFIGYAGLDGTMPCVSHGEVQAPEGATPPGRQRAAPMTRIQTSPDWQRDRDQTGGQGDGMPVIMVTRPVFADDALSGFLSITITRRALELMAQRVIEDAPHMAVLVNREGAVLSRRPESGALALLPDAPVLATIAAAGGNQVVRSETAEGEPAVYAMAELIPGQLYALAMWERTAPVLKALEARRLPLLFPAAMWLACLAVVLLAVHYLVLRHLKGLNRQMRRFALGQREDWPDLPGRAPGEIRALHATFRSMARLIGRDEEERERALAEKTVLLKEIHHRVKNNLQLIASVINLQLRQMADPAARGVLHSVQQRVLGLASVHRALYSEDRLAQVRADRVIEELLARLTSIGAAPGRAPSLRLNLAPLALEADQMVPLSLLLHEGMTNALKHLATAEGAGNAWIAVDLQHEPETAPETVNAAGTATSAPDGAGGTGTADTETGDAGSEGTGWVVLRLRNPLGAAAPAAAAASPFADTAADGPSDVPSDTAATASGDGLGGELIEAFAMQLGGTCQQTETRDDNGNGLWQLELRFPAPKTLTEAGSSAGA